MKLYYNSIYSTHIKQFIDMKQALGFKFESGSFMLSRIDRFADLCGETSPGITKDFADKWSKEQPNESAMYRYERVRNLAVFSSYLCDLGIQSYIPRLLPFPKGTFVPYIYSKTEIEAIFKAVARSLKMAVRQDPQNMQVPSTKGVL